MNYENLEKIAVSKECLQAFKNSFEQEMLAKAITLDELQMTFEEQKEMIVATFNYLGKEMNELELQKLLIGETPLTDEEKGKLLEYQIQENPLVKRDTEFCYGQFIEFLEKSNENKVQIRKLSEEIGKLESRIVTIQ
jgi:hypothetical protein